MCLLVVCPGIGSPEGIAFDWINKRIYYSDYTNQMIKSIAMDGSRHTLIAQVPKPRGIVLDPCQGYVMIAYFWRERGLKLSYVNREPVFRGLVIL